MPGSVSSGSRSSCSRTASSPSTWTENDNIGKKSEKKIPFGIYLSITRMVGLLKSMPRNSGDRQYHSTGITAIYTKIVNPAEEHVFHVRRTRIETSIRTFAAGQNGELSWSW